MFEGYMLRTGFNIRNVIRKLVTDLRNGNTSCDKGILRKEIYSRYFYLVKNTKMVRYIFMHSEDFFLIHLTKNTIL